MRARLSALLSRCLLGAALGAAVLVPLHAAAQVPAISTDSQGALKLPAPVEFETASDKLKPQGEASLLLVKAYLESKPYITLLRVEAHTDNQGDAAANQTLTERRAEKIARWLIAKGIDCKRLIAVGFGGTKPVADTRTPEGRAQNRRVVFVNAALRGRLIGGMPADGGGQLAGDLCK